MTTEQKLISASLLRLRMKSPFFATLALFARFVLSQQLPTAATDGKDIFFNLEYLLSLPTDQQDGLLLHEVLHAALLHVPRRGVRDRTLWNIAADIVVNGIISQQGVFTLPPGGLRDPNLEHLSVEEIYELLLKDTSQCPNLPNPDLLESSPTGGVTPAMNGTNTTTLPLPPTDHAPNPHFVGSPSSPLPTPVFLESPPQDSDGEADSNSSQSSSQSKIAGDGDSLSSAKKAALEAHWQNALQQAAVIARTVNQGKLPAGMERELGALTAAQIDWRAYLWRYLVQTPTDFSGFDRRFIGRRLYLETLQGESVQVYVAVDTSGSIDRQQLRMFLSEVQGILNAYPHLKCELYYVDAEAYGPYELNPDSTLPNPQGGGGTSFVPFFEKVAASWDGYTQEVCVYLTDGYGTFPEKASLPVLWVVTPGGLGLEAFPFGEAVRLLSV